MSLAYPHIESERLKLRLLEAEDLESAIDYWRRNQEHLMQSGPTWPDDFLTPSFWEKQIERNKKEFEGDISARMYLFEKTGSLIAGHVSLAGILRGAAQFCYLGYGLDFEKQGKGYMNEILKETIRYAFESLKLHRIMANYMPTNAKSGKVLKKLGFSIEGYARDYLFLNGKWEDHIMCAITNQSWQE